MTNYERDRALVASACAGSVRALDELLKTHRIPMIRVAFTLLHNADDAEDAAQIASLRAFRSLHTFVPHASFSKWLAVIVRNVAIDLIRRKNSTARFWMALASAAENASLDPEVTALQTERSEALIAALALLPNMYRDPLHLYYLSDLSYSEVAFCLRIPIGTVKTHMYRGKALLRKVPSLAPFDLFRALPA